jgi:penicillin amidase
MIRLSRSLCALAPLLLLGPSLTGADAPTDKISLPGLNQAVEILRDKWGISHIYAGTEHDLFFAQGYNVARDRLFQLELWRRQATGTMAEITGRKELKRDIGNPSSCTAAICSMNSTGTTRTVRPSYRPSWPA